MKHMRDKAFLDSNIIDSLIVATALENGCTILYSEDMQHEQIIEKQIKIINPFESCQDDQE